MAVRANSNLRDISSAAAMLIAFGMAASAWSAGAPAAPAPPVAPVAPVAPAAASAETGASPEAAAALRRAIVYHREAQDLALSFSASVYNAALDKRDEYKGRLWLKGPDKFRLEIPGGVYVSDGKAYWEYHARNHQAIRRNAADREGAPAPGEVLLRFLDSDPLSSSHVRENGKEWIELRLDPSRALKSLDSLSVRLDKSTSALHQVASRDVSGNEARYTVASVKRNAGLKDAEFSFVPPKGVEVVDMRGE